MADTTVTIKLSVKETNIVLKQLRESQKLLEEVSKLAPEPVSRFEDGRREGGPAERHKQRQQALELQTIIEKIES